MTLSENLKELKAQQVRIADDFWSPRLEMNACVALAHQWAQLEKTACFDNFRLVAGEKEGFRQGWFFADSDAYKWLDAAARAYATHPSTELAARMEELVTLIGAAQAQDGYLYTYNQLHFPDVRWTNLQIEHELYAHGHLIEAAVSHYEATGRRDLLDIGKKAADLLVREFLGAGPERTPGHQEIELALIRLYRATGQENYIELAAHFLEQRGRTGLFARHILRQNRSVGRRGKWVEGHQARYLDAHPKYTPAQLPSNNVSKKPPLIQLRFFLSALSGRYFQQHRPVRQQMVPVGHAVRFAYLETALAMLYRERSDETLLPVLEQAWQHMVERRMYITGGLGSLPTIEGFGGDYELDPEYAYAETCAALGCMFWNWEMALITHQARYADLFEWQLYNAAAVGMGLDGTSYLYNNPLACRGGVTRQAWYHVPCCPSNLSRTWASLRTYIYSFDADNLWVHQYIGSETDAALDGTTQIEMESGLPWQGRVRITLTPETPAAFTLHLRVPGWADVYRLWVNEQAQVPSVDAGLPVSTEDAASIGGVSYAP